mgnify:CR=1 FL=1
MNSLYQQLNQEGNLSSLNNIKNLMKTLQGASNPSQMIMNMASSNPQLKDVLTLVQNSNMSPKDLFYKLAKEKGVNPDDILSQLQ